MSIAFAAEKNSGMNRAELADPTAFIIVANRTSGVDEFEPASGDREMEP
jgi:hypothetical protein